MTTTQHILTRFSAWFADAQASADIADATAVTLATANAETNAPSARVLLLKGFDERGFVFFTNYHSRKAGELIHNPQAALCFHWPPLGRQVRVEGRVEKTSEAESDAYFLSRPLESRLGAWASDQSAPIASREALMRRFEAAKAKYGEHVPRPPHWGGFRLIPDMIEFWQHGDHRLHDRECYLRGDDGWKVVRLSP